MTRQCILFLLSTNFTRPNCSYFVLDTEPVKGQFFPGCAGIFLTDRRLMTKRHVLWHKTVWHNWVFCCRFFLVGRTMFYHRNSDCPIANNSYAIKNVWLYRMFGPCFTAFLSHILPLILQKKSQQEASGEIHCDTGAASMLLKPQYL